MDERRYRTRALRILSATAFTVGKTFFLATLGTAQASRANDPSRGLAQESAASSVSSPPAGKHFDQTLGRKSIGVALEGGGALGLAHIGVLRWFEDNHVPVDRISGTSMGALIGGLYASGVPTSDLSNILTKRTAIFRLQTPYDDISFRRREDRRDLPQALSLDIEGGIGLRNAALSDAGLNELLLTSFANYLDRDLNYNNLPIPFRCVATDLDTLLPVVFDHGSLAASVRASLSIPGVFEPVIHDGHSLVDGAIVDNLPTDVARTDLESDIVIGVHLQTPSLRSGDIGSIAGVFARAYAAGTAQTERRAKRYADVFLVVDTQRFSATDYEKATELIAAGYQAAEEYRAILFPLRLSDDEWSTYLATRARRKSPDAGTLTHIEMAGGSKGASSVAKKDTSNLVGKPIDVGRLAQALRPVEANGTYQATLETFSTRFHLGGKTEPEEEPVDGVVVHLTPNQKAKTVLLLGLDVTAENSNVTRALLDFRLINHDLGSFQSELRTDVRLGYLTRLSTEYYWRLSGSGYFLQPRLDLLRAPVYLWSGQRRVSERFEQLAGGAVEIGRAFGRDTKIDAEWRMQTVRWSLRTGQDQSQDYSGVIQKGLLHFNFDNAVSGAVASRGSRIDLSTGVLTRSSSRDATPVLQLHTSHTFGPGESTIFALGTQVETYFRHNVPDALRFTLGGPLRLSASSFDEYRGTDTVLLRGAYLKRFAKMPEGLGQGVYASLAYEAGEIWSTEHHAVLRQDGIAGVVAATAFGVITVSGSVGDAGHRKIFFSLGRLF